MNTIKTLLFSLFLISISINFNAQYCSDGDKAILQDIWIALGEPDLNGWDFTPGLELYDWEGIQMTTDGCHIKQIAFNGNTISDPLIGTISPAISELNYLEVLAFQNNPLLTGGIPIPNESTIFMFLENNDLNGSLPDLSDLTNLLTLDLQGNQLSGTIPNSLGLLPNLSSLDLTNNNITGCIPVSFQNYCGQSSIHFENNPMGNTGFSSFCNSDFGLCGNQLITTWNTENAGSPSNQIIIPTINSGENYNFVVDWGDGTIQEFIGIAPDLSHTYDNPGIYEVSFYSNFQLYEKLPRLFFNNEGDKEKLLAVNQWGINKWTSMEGAFYGCSNLEILATDNPDLSLVENMAHAFHGCSSLNQDIGSWNISTVTI